MSLQVLRGQKPVFANFGHDSVLAHDAPSMQSVKRQCVVERQTARSVRTNVAVRQNQGSGTAVLDRPAPQTPESSTRTHEAEEEKFVWRENWYPVQNISNLYKHRPNKVTVLNEEVVIWWAEDNTWHAARDRCPHKLAPLSEGRMDNDVLECRYHGWQFNAKGDCKFSPQSTKVPRACLDMFPAQEEHGMLWVWPQAGADAFLKSLNKPLPVQDKYKAPLFPVLSPDYFFFKSSADWGIMVDNAMDPSHAPALHEGNVGGRKEMVEMKMKVDKSHPVKGFVARHDGYLKSQQDANMKAERVFIPPCTIRTHYTDDTGKTVDSALFFTPEKPGSTLVFGKFLFSSTKKGEEGKQGLRQKLQPKLMKAATKAYLSIMSALGISKDVPVHNFDQLLLNQDGLMLTECDRIMNEAGMSHKDYRLASQADAGVAAFWSWVDKHGGGPAWAGNISATERAPAQSREQLFNHYERHTRHCPQCLTALTKIDSLIERASYAMAALAGLVIIFKDSTWLRATAVIGLAALFLGQKALQSYRQKFYGLSKLPDDE